MVGGRVSPNRREKFALARYREDGRLDRSFGDDGLVKTKFKPLSSIADVALQTDGKIVAVGRSEEIDNTFALARYNRDGTLDRTFSREGKASTGRSARPDIRGGWNRHCGPWLAGTGVRL